MKRDTKLQIADALIDIKLALNEYNRILISDLLLDSRSDRLEVGFKAIEIIAKIIREA